LQIAAVDQVGDLPAGEAPHLGLALLEQMARQVEAERRFLQQQPLADAPGLGLHQRRLLRGRAVVAVVEQTTLRGVVDLVVGEVETQRDAGQQAGTIRMQRVERTALDQRLDRTLVDPLAVDAGAEVEEAVERAAGLARLDDGLHRALA